MRRVLLTLALASGAALAAQEPARVQPERILGHVRWLAADELAGRGNGTAGLERAARYIQEQFVTAGLSGGLDGGFAQRFDADVRLDPPAGTPLVIDSGATRQTLVLGREYYPLSVLERTPSEPPPAVETAPVVFAGYGIVAPALQYDDYATVDVRGAAVVVFTHEPQEHDPRSVFDGRNLTPGAAVSQKAREARERGARLLLVVEDPSHADDRATRAAWWSDPQSENMGIPVLRVARDQAGKVFVGLDLEAVAAQIDRTLKPQSRRLEGVTVSYVEHRAQFTAGLHNIVGVLRGTDPVLGREAVVVGAHYDHIGTSGELSEAPAAGGQIHNGADDNASGVAVLLELAHAAGRRRARFRRTVVFAAFAGEEIGLRGSERYAAAPAVPLAQTRAMLNLDMVGRARGRVLVGTFGPRLPGVPVLTRLRGWTRLTVQDFTRGGYTEDESDVAPFARRGIPAIAFFTGFHADYHRPSDDWGAIDAEGGAAIAELALRLLEDLAR